MKIVAVYDNLGVTYDRYTVLTDNPYIDSTNGFTECLSLSKDPSSPDGVSQWGGCIPGEHLGRKIAFEQLPAELQKHIAKLVFELSDAPS